MRKEIKLEKCHIPRDIFTMPVKVYYDGNHFVGVPVIKKECVTRPKGGNGLVDETAYFDEKYAELLATGMKPNARKMFLPLHNAMLTEYPSLPNVIDFVNDNIKRHRHNYFSRLKRLVRKANLNIWNKWVTITYDPKKHDEYTFRTKLKKCLSNLHTRHGWRYMGVFERAPETDRLHFHAIMYIPDNQMVGKITEVRDFSLSQHIMQVTHSNDFFVRRFGRNDFEDLNEVDLTMGRTIEYLTKYISKTNERITYSRGIPTDLTVYVEQRDVACFYVDYVTKCVLFDDCVDKVNGYIPSKTLKFGQWSIDDYLKNSA